MNKDQPKHPHNGWAICASIAWTLVFVGVIVIILGGPGWPLILLPIIPAAAWSIMAVEQNRLNL